MLLFFYATPCSRLRKAAYAHYSFRMLLIRACADVVYVNRARQAGCLAALVFTSLKEIVCGRAYCLWVVCELSFIAESLTAVEKTTYFLFCRL